MWGRSEIWMAENESDGTSETGNRMRSEKYANTAAKCIAIKEIFVSPTYIV